MRESQKMGIDVCIINHRGFAGAKLRTPVFYSGAGYQDESEAMCYVIQKYCRFKILKNGNKIKKTCKVFAIGCSIGGNILGHVLGHQNI